MNHLTITQIRAFQARQLAPSELMEIDDHFAACAECRATLQSDPGSDPSIAQLRVAFRDAEPHLSYKDIRQLAEGGTLTAAATSHFAQCKLCMNEVADLKQFINEQPASSFLQTQSKNNLFRFPKLNPVWIGLAAAAVLLLAVGIYRQSSSHLPAAPQMVASLNDGDTQLQLDKRGVLHGAENLPADFQADLTKAITTGKLEAASPISTVNLTDETMLGSPQSAPSFRVLAPVGQAVIDDRPTFRWQAAPDADHYRVMIYAAGYKKIAESDNLNALEWKSTKALPRGAQYTWTVTAYSKKSAVRQPAPPAPEAKFKIMSADLATFLTDIQAAHPNDHLLIAILDARAGALDEAQIQLKQLKSKNPGNKLAAQLEASLDQRSPSPIKTKEAQ